MRRIQDKSVAFLPKSVEKLHFSFDFVNLLNFQTNLASDQEKFDEQLEKERRVLFGVKHSNAYKVHK
jgi:hypothetical protein